MRGMGTRLIRLNLLVFAPPIKMSKSAPVSYVLAAIALHNWVKKRNDQQATCGRQYFPPGYVDYEDSHGIVHKGIWRSENCEGGALQDINITSGHNYSKKSESLRSLFAEYFVSSVGELPWQYDYVRRASYEPVLS